MPPFNSASNSFFLSGVNSNASEDSDQCQQKSEYRNRALNPPVIEQSVLEDSMRIKKVGEREWNLGKISVILLLLFSLSDVVLNFVDTQLNALEAFELYDALSSEVIRPPFQYRSTVERKTRKGTERKTIKPKTRKTHVQHAFTISSPEPFVPLDDIAQLTLNDVTMTFRFAIESTQVGFNKGRFISGAGPRIRRIFDRMSMAAANSRGKNVIGPMTGLQSNWGDIDALLFCAAMRIFAEWRVLRQIPDGYKAYAVGMSLGQKDIIQNVAKIEQAVHEMIDLAASEDDATEKSEKGTLKSPTLRELLQFEVDTNVHTKLPRLKERSAGMGLLWVRRQLQYQTTLFSNVMKVPEKFESSRAAVTAAYSEVFDRYHGWAVQKIFNYSFQALPEVREIYRFMNPYRLKEVSEAATLEFRGSENSHGMHHKEIVLDNVEKQIGYEWNKVFKSVLYLFMKSSQEEVGLIHNNSHEQEATPEVSIDDYINQEMVRDAHEQISQYMKVAQPLLINLASLFREYNMDDPTRV